MTSEHPENKLRKRCPVSTYKAENAYFLNMVTKNRYLPTYLLFEHVHTFLSFERGHKYVSVFWRWPQKNCVLYMAGNMYLVFEHNHKFLLFEHGCKYLPFEHGRKPCFLNTSTNSCFLNMPTNTCLLGYFWS